jgi:hypothetical protein
VSNLEIGMTKKEHNNKSNALNSNRFGFRK